MTKPKRSTANKSIKQSLSVPRRRFWITIACIMTVVLWYMLVVFISLGLNQLTANSKPGDLTDQFYDGIVLLTAVAPYIASLITAPVAYWVFRQLDVKKAGLSGVTAAMAPALVFYVFMLAYNVFPAAWNPENGVLVGIFLASIIIVALWTVWLLKKGQELFTDKWLTVIEAVVPAVIASLAYVSWLLVTRQL